MRRIVLMCVNGALTIALALTLTIVGFAEPRLGVSDLTYGKVDMDGDGRCTYGDDYVLQWLVENNYSILESALPSAKTNAEGIVDLGAFFSAFTATPNVSAEQ
jgi:hypothetical protein